MATQDSPAAVSVTLLAAQERLLELRKAHQATKVGRSTTTAVRQPAHHHPQPTLAERPSLAAAITALPEHLGWENPRLTDHIRRIRNCELRIDNEERRATSGDPATGGPDGQTAVPSPQPPTPSCYVKVYPDLALAMLRHKQSAAGRVWLLLRRLDAQGRGWLTVREAAEALTADSAPLRICGRRQLNNLLQKGDGLFWERSAVPDLRGFGKPLRCKGASTEPRIWLRSVARVAAALGVQRLGTAPVAVDITALTGAIGHVRAHFFASFHSGRQKTDFVSGQARARGPIARETLQHLSAACPNSQRAYEKRAGVAHKAAYAIGPEAPRHNAQSSATQTAEAQNTAWRRGRSFFKLIDYNGRFGRPGRTYLAWQLPNEYTGPHMRLSRSRMKRMNRALADLLVNGMTGNDERPSGPRPPAKRFFGNAKAAWTAERQGQQGDEMYWRAPDGAWRVWAAEENYELRIRNYELRMPDGSLPIPNP